MRGSPATPLKSATLWGSCCSKTTKVVFVAESCWFYQKVKKIGATNENWVFQGAGGRYFCQGAPDQYVANLQYHLRHWYGNIYGPQNQVWLSVQNRDFSIFWLPKTDFQQNHQQRSLLLLQVFNKIVVFRQQMLIFQHFPLSFMRKSKKWWKNNICCRKTTILLFFNRIDVLLLLATAINSAMETLWVLTYFLLIFYAYFA